MLIYETLNFLIFVHLTEVCIHEDFPSEVYPNALHVIPHQYVGVLTVRITFTHLHFLTAKQRSGGPRIFQTGAPTPKGGRVPNYYFAYFPPKKCMKIWPRTRGLASPAPLPLRSATATVISIIVFHRIL